MSASPHQFEDLPIDSSFDKSQLSQIETELNLVAIAAMAVSGIDRLGLMQIVNDLQLESPTIGEWVSEWATDRRGSKKLDLRQIRSIVTIVHHLAHTHQSKIRQNILNWQQTIRYNQLPLQSPELADYIGKFITIYQARIGAKATESFESLADIALTLLVDLLFYSSDNGRRRLWDAVVPQADAV